MKIVVNILLVFHALYLSLSCDPGVGVPAKINELVSVNSFISPHDTLFVVYAYNVQHFGTIADLPAAAVRDALVILKDEEASDTLIFQVISGRYEARPKNITVKAGNRYYLLITLATGKLLSATCTVPEAPDFPVVSGLRDDDDYLFQIQWTNTAKHDHSAIAVMGTGTYELETPRGVFTVTVSARLDEGSYVLTEQKELNSVEGVASNAYRSSEPGLKVTLWNVDQNMYLYYDSFQNFDNWASNNDEGGLPNFREQQSLYSNILNGVGVFGAYNINESIVDIQ